MSGNPDVIVLGAGAAGLSAAVELSRAGLTVAIIEARDRIGGRIFTLRDPVCNAPIELGAEFIHGKPPEIWDLLQHNNLHAKEVDGDIWCVRDGKLSTCAFFSEVDQLLEQMDDSKPDESFLQFLERCCGDSRITQTAKDWARGYVTGFHAADPAQISVHSLVKGLRADEKIEGDRAFRIAPQGYEALLNVLRRELQTENVSLQLNTVATAIGWRRGNIELSIRNHSGVITMTAPRLLITLPLSILQATPEEPFAVRFVPDLPRQKQAALDKLAMGKVIRVTLRFRERFWEHLRPPHSTESKSLANMSFLLSQEDWFPTWWTTMPEKLPIITGWAPFRRAERLSGHSTDFVIDTSLHSLSSLLKVSTCELERLFAQAYW
ncbi:MAG TPA: FAD-dependent oxidoreductase, partial [Terriglobales bacterium]|nr:FAD-dependent oxidoreductase [Terriglobales bacterium]